MSTFLLAFFPSFVPSNYPAGPPQIFISDLAVVYTLRAYSVRENRSPLLIRVSLLSLPPLISICLTICLSYWGCFSVRRRRRCWISRKTTPDKIRSRERYRVAASLEHSSFVLFPPRMRLRLNPPRLIGTRKTSRRSSGRNCRNQSCYLPAKRSIYRVLLPSRS